MNDEFIDIVARCNYLILDTETTGLEKPAEICQIAIIDQNGETWLDTLVHTVHPIPPAATAIHHITDVDVEAAPTWGDLAEAIQHYLEGRDVIVYNAQYDRKLMHWSDEAAGLHHIDWKLFGRWHCAMEAYAEYWGERHPYYGSYKWQSLSMAVAQQGLTPNNAHNALGDCLMTYQLMQRCVAKLMDSRKDTPHE